MARGRAPSCSDGRFVLSLLKMFLWTSTKIGCSDEVVRSSFVSSHHDCKQAPHYLEDKLASTEPSGPGSPVAKWLPVSRDATAARSRLQATVSSTRGSHICCKLQRSCNSGMRATISSPYHRAKNDSRRTKLLNLCPIAS